jgi:hypothetical protein
VDSVQIKGQIEFDKHVKEDGNTILKGILAHLKPRKYTNGESKSRVNAVEKNPVSILHNGLT